ncbi:MAG: DUF4334 domain-containing protein [Pseudomonadota bacterium]
MEDAMHNLLKGAPSTPEEAFAAFDALPTVSNEFMLGRWTLHEVLTGHPLDGLLEPGGLYGKIFDSEEDVHPLVFITTDKTEIYAANPSLIPLTVDLPKEDIIGSVINTARFVLETKESKARLRMVEYRGRVTACMLYDDRPIIDAFVKIDEERVLGVMDMKGNPVPYFFVLKRDPSVLPFGPTAAREDRFVELFDMEVQNRAFALKVNKDLGANAVGDANKMFYTAWIAFEEFLQHAYAPVAEKYGLDQAPRAGANLQVGLARFGAGMLPEDIMTRMVLQDTIKYLEKLKELYRVSPVEDREFFAFVVKHEEAQIEALRLRGEGNKEAAAQLLTSFVADNAGHSQA